MEKNFTEKIYFYLLKMKSFFQKRNPIFSISLDRDYLTHFLNFM